MKNPNPTGKEEIAKSPNPTLHSGGGCTLWNGDFVIPQVKTVNRGVETIRYRGPLTWDIVPEDIRNAESVLIFKNKIKDWKPTGCTCRLCKTYIPGLGYGIMKDGALV